MSYPRAPSHPVAADTMTAYVAAKAAAGLGGN